MPPLACPWKTARWQIASYAHPKGVPLRNLSQMTDTVRARLLLDGPFFIRAPGMARSAVTGAVPVHVVVAGRLGGASPLLARQGEQLAEGKGAHREVGSEGSLRTLAFTAKHWLDEQEPHTRQQRGMRRRNSSKSNTCTERAAVYAASISGKVARLTLGGLVTCWQQLSLPRGKRDG